MIGVDEISLLRLAVFVRRGSVIRVTYAYCAKWIKNSETIHPAMNCLTIFITVESLFQLVILSYRFRSFLRESNVNPIKKLLYKRMVMSSMARKSRSA